MPQAWDADVQIDEAVARELIESQFPNVRIEALRHFGEGWDNAAFLINEELVFRFPRRKMAARLIEHECRILPVLAPDLPLPIPIPIYVGSPQGTYPYSFAGYQALTGEPACTVSWTDEIKRENAAKLGQFLKALHAIKVDKKTRRWAPIDDIRRADLPYRFEQAKRIVSERPDCFGGYNFEKHLALMGELAQSAAHAGATCWLHGDLYSCHLLLKDEHISGVIDWGDVHLGDPAIDLSIAFSWLPASTRQDFMDAYGTIDENMWNRARGRALHYGFTFLWYGHDTGKAKDIATGEFIVQNAST